MPYKKKQSIPGSIQFNEQIAELPHKKKKYNHKFDSDMTF